MQEINANIIKGSKFIENAFGTSCSSIWSTNLPLLLLLEREYFQKRSKELGFIDFIELIISRPPSFFADNLIAARLNQVCNKNDACRKRMFELHRHKASSNPFISSLTGFVPMWKRAHTQYESNGVKTVRIT
jgi:hypothetical protein